MENESQTTQTESNPATTTTAAPENLLNTQQATGEQKPGEQNGEQKPGEQTGEQNTEQQQQEQEVSYELQLPDGYTLDEETGGDLKAFAKEHKMSNEEAQKLLDIGLKQRMKEVDAFNQQRETWRETVRTDPEIGGANLQANLTLAKKAVETFGTPGAKELLNGSWLGDHPDIIKLLVNVGKAVSEDGVIPPGTQRTTERDPAKTLFPNMK